MTTTLKSFIRRGIALAVTFVALEAVGCIDHRGGAGRVATPIFAPEGGAYGTDQAVTIISSMPDAIIRFSVDGSDPTESSPIHEADILVSGHETVMKIKAFATKPGMNDSEIAEANYAIRYPGRLDSGFSAAGPGANAPVQAVAALSDGKVLIAGNFTSYNGFSRNRIARLNVDGSLDEAFPAAGTGEAGAAGEVDSVALQADGKILIGGFFTQYNGSMRGHIARLNEDGSLDETFLASGSGADGAVLSIVVLDGGKILIGGEFSHYNGASRARLARLNADGSLDGSFLATGAGTNNYVVAIAALSDGKVLIGGNFTSFAGNPLYKYLARLDSAGNLDTSFQSAGPDSTVMAISPQGDGSILIAGYFTNYGFVTRGAVARLASDGSLDTTFLGSGAGADNSVYALAVLGDGKILIAGRFTWYDVFPRDRIARLNADGSLDTYFLGSSVGANNAVHSLAVQADGKILIGGSFSQYDYALRGNVARLWN